jgi:chromate transporter
MLAEREPVSPPHPSFAAALRFWVKLGFISFGGPAGQIAIMHRELVERRRWIGEERFLHALNYCMLLPGPEAMQLATYVGWLLHRTAGALVAGGFFVVPSIFVLLGLSYVYAAYGQVPAVVGVLGGFKPVVVAIVLEAAIKIGRRALKRRAHTALAAAAFVAIYALAVPFPAIIAAAAIIGWAGTRIAPQWFAASAGAAAAAVPVPAVIDDRAPLPAHTRPSGRRALRVLAVAAGLWLAPLLGLVLWRGWSSLHAQEYRFFTLAAFVTFGGAYAVLAYVTQVATHGFHWLTHAQAVDGLALAETTPGPLIMVLQFVGFLAGWNHPGDSSPAASAVLGAVVTTWTTFLPCFVFILVGAPYVERIRGNRSLGAALAGVTAAVVGVVLNLAVVFGAAVIWPHGLAGGTAWFAVLLTSAAFAVLYRYHVDVVWVVLAGGVIGLLRYVVGG